MKVTRFELKDEMYGRPNQAYRIAFGELIHVEERKSLPIEDFFNDEEGELTGSIGFVDVSLRNPNEALLTRIGVEPQYQNNGLGSKLVEEAERFARESGRKTLTTTRIESPYLYAILKKRGYTIINDGAQRTNN